MSAIPSVGYRAAIYFAVATMHFYRDDLSPSRSDQSAEDYAEENNAVLRQVCAEAREHIRYELSHGQIIRAVKAYLAPAVSLTKEVNGG